MKRIGQLREQHKMTDNVLPMDRIQIEVKDEPPGVLNAFFDFSGLSPAAKVALEGMIGHFAECIKAVFRTHDLQLDNQAYLESLLIKTTAKLEQGLKPIRTVSDNGEPVIFSILEDTTELAYWWMQAAGIALRRDQIGSAIKFFGQSVQLTSFVKPWTDMLEEAIADASSGKPRFNPVLNARKGAKARHAKEKELKGYAIELYLGKKWRSKRDAAKKIIRDVVLKGNEIGVNLTDGNAERTVYQWLMSCGKPSAGQT
jgi:hypothetical protein